MGIGPTQPAWKAGVLPLNYTRVTHNACIFYQNNSALSNDFRCFLKNFVKDFLHRKTDENVLFFALFQPQPKQNYHRREAQNAEQKPRKIISVSRLDHRPALLFRHIHSVALLFLPGNGRQIFHAVNGMPVVYVNGLFLLRLFFFLFLRF